MHFMVSQSSRQAEMTKLVAATHKRVIKQNFQNMEELASNVKSICS